MLVEKVKSVQHGDEELEVSKQTSYNFIPGEVIKNKFYIGGEGVAASEEVVRVYGITHIVMLCS